LSQYAGLKEIAVRRTYNQKVYIDGRDTRHRIHSRHIHYKDGVELKEIDTRLIKGLDNKWRHSKASYHPVIPEYADEWFEFYNAYEGANHTIKAKPVASHVKGQYTHTENGEDYILYPNAFGTDVDLVVYSYWAGLKKVIRLNKKPLITSSDISFIFELDCGALPIKDPAGVIWTGLSALDFKNKIIKIGDTGKESYFKNAMLWDSGQIRNHVDIELYRSGGKTYLRKTIPAKVLQDAAYPLFTDHPTSYYSGAGDGEISGMKTSWNSIHDSTEETAWPTSSPGYCNTGKPLSNYYNVARFFLSIDTSGIDDGATITSASLKLYFNTAQTGEADGYDYITVVQGFQASTHTLVGTDFNDCGDSADDPTEGIDSGDRVDCDDIVTDDYMTFALNSTGIGWINKTGVTKLGAREGHDTADEKPDNAYAYSGGFIYTSEASGEGTDPYLDVTVSGGGEPNPPRQRRVIGGW
jgi:hypothetical protein